MKFKLIDNNIFLEIKSESADDALLIGRLSAKLENSLIRVPQGSPPRITKDNGLYVLTCNLANLVNLASA